MLTVVEAYINNLFNPTVCQSTAALGKFPPALAELEPREALQWGAVDAFQRFRLYCKPKELQWPVAEVQLSGPSCPPHVNILV